MNINVAVGRLVFVSVFIMALAVGPQAAGAHEWVHSQPTPPPPISPARVAPSLKRRRRERCTDFKHIARE